MTTKTQLQNKIQELESELQEFKKQLDSYKEITIENASVGDTLEDGSIILQKSNGLEYNGLALLVAPKNTEVGCSWSKEFSDVFEKLKEQGFNPSQWFIPTKEQLQLAYNTIPDEFSETIYWSSTEVSSTFACTQHFSNGFITSSGKADSHRVRAFRCVTY